MKRNTEVPFAKLHADIVGPYRSSNGESLMYVVTIIDSATGYAVVKPTKHCPTSNDIVETFQYLTEVFCTSPLVVHTDNGSVFISDRFSKYLRSIKAIHERSAVFASWSNGKVERLHRDINAYIRCANRSVNLTYNTFRELVKTAVVQHNTIPRRNGISPHNKVFRFKPELELLKPIELRAGYEDLLGSDNNPNDLPETLTKDTEVLCRKHVQGQKYEPVWEKVVVLRRVALNMYEVAAKDKKGQWYARIEHTKNLKRLSPPAEQCEPRSDDEQHNDHKQDQITSDNPETVSQVRVQQHVQEQHDP
ncbi:hypothetical protein Pmar_PMAR008638, partial [Perkinsus marinus ATCC 50983]